DPTAKMSKSASTPGGLLELLEDPAALRKKIRGAVTDTGREVRYDAEHKPGVSNLLTIGAALTGRRIAEFEAAEAGRRDGELKKELAELVVAFVEPVQRRTAELTDDPAELDRLLAFGAERARAVATETLQLVYDRIGFLPAAKG